jgi:hypothetical protein
MRHFALAASLTLVISSQALAWSAAGHKFVAPSGFFEKRLLACFFLHRPALQFGLHD